MRKKERETQCFHGARANLPTPLLLFISPIFAYLGQENILEQLIRFVLILGDIGVGIETEDVRIGIQWQILDVGHVGLVLGKEIDADWPEQRQFFLGILTSPSGGE